MSRSVLPPALPELPLPRLLLAMLASLGLTACGGLSDVGQQENADTPPQAVVTVIGQPSTVSGDKVTVMARSGAELLLSGKDSKEFVVPILEFKWQPLNDEARGLSIIQRNNSTIAFGLPAAAATTTYRLRLEVIDSNGERDSQDVDVVAEAVPDPNQFLSYLDTPASFQVVAVTASDFIPCPDATTGPGCLSADTPFTIDIESRVEYWDISGQFNGAGGNHPAVVVNTRSFSGSWLKSLGASQDCSAIHNPRYSASIPTLDADDVTAAVQKDAPGRVMDVSRIDDAQVFVTIRISQQTQTLPPEMLRVCVPDLEAVANGSGINKPRSGPLRSAKAAPVVEFTRDQLLTALVPIHQPTPEAPEDQADAIVQDTRETALAYYATIDTTEDAARKQTFIGWLRANEFLPSTGGDAIDWAAVAAGSDSHATYVNNFDLGFGRDMYMRKLRCSAAGDCDVASVVINYASLEAAAKKLGPQLAVAMEYSRTGTSGPRFVKFYTYAPDVRCDPRNPPASGCSQFRRALSANLDGRGEKYMPGTCTICHGGAPLGLDAADPARYAARNAHAAPGDVNAAFLPWDLQSFLFSDDSQAGFPDDTSNAVHHRLWEATRRSAQAPAIKALNDLAKLTYRDPEGDPSQMNRYALLHELVDGWYSNATGTFDNTFVPDSWNQDQSQHSLYVDVFAQHCRMCHVAHVPNAADAGIGGVDPFSACSSASQSEPYTGTNRQIAFGCYQQFVNAANLADRLGAGTMPGARLTADRFWVGSDGTVASSAAEKMRTHLGSLQPAMTYSTPGPVACFTGLPEDTDLQTGDTYSLDSSCSALPSFYRWDLEKPDGSAARLVFRDTPFPQLRDVDLKGDYIVSLSINDTVPAAVKPRSRADTTPQAKPPKTHPVIYKGNAVLVDVTGEFDEGDGTKSLLGSTVASTEPALVEAVAVNGQVRLTALSMHDTDIEVTYSVADGDGDQAEGSLFVHVVGSLSASPVPTDTAVRRTGAIDDQAIDLALGGATILTGVNLQYCLLSGTDCDADGTITPSLGGSAVLTDATSGAVRYTPPAGVMSTFIRSGGARTSLGTPATFRYRVCYEGETNAGNCEENTVTVDLQGREADGAILFSKLHTNAVDGHSFNNQCSGCHADGANGGWLHDSDKDTFCSLVNDGYVVRTAPGTSQIHTKPNGGHLAAPTTKGSQDTRDRILRWIEEGAYYTDDTSQTCPP